MPEEFNFDDALIKNAQGGEGSPENTPTEDTPKAVEPEVVPEVEPKEDDAGISQVEDDTVPNEPDASIEDGTPPAEETPTEEEAVPEVNVFDDWDVVDDSEEPTVVAEDVTILNELGFEGLTVEQAKAKIKELSDGPAPEDPFAGLPENLKQAITLAKKDGDWLQLLGVNSVDYNTIDDNVLLQNSLAPYFTDAETGVLDKDGLIDHLEDMSEVDKRIRARQLKDDLIYKQNIESQRIEAEAAKARATADIELKKALDSTSEIKSYKLSSAHKKELYEGISSGKMIQEMFFDKNGAMDYNKVIDSYFNHLYGKKADSFMRQRLASSAKKDLLKKLGNVEVEPKPSGLPEVAPEGYDPQAALAKHLMGK
jgi:hypothetical protein